jgi:hypothetical protein
MMIRNLAVLLLLLSAPSTLLGQYRTRRPSGSPATLDGFKGVVVNFHGKLKILDKKKIVIETEANELLNIRLSSKTKFFNNGKAVKPASIDLETPVTVDAIEDTGLMVMAVEVTVDSPAKKDSPEKTDPKPN